jgi:Zn-dependent M28 family amino/carboxypeptidase
MGMLYVLDEPSIRLHPKDHVKMIETLKRLRDLGNTVIVVEHDADTIRAGDSILEIGPVPGVSSTSARREATTKCPRPKRTIRFVLFSGEEQGNHGSMAFVKQHNDEMPKTSAFLNHDRGTGKVIGLAWAGEREALGPILETQMVSLKELGANYVDGRTTSSSDHWSFSDVGVPACAVDQEIAGYRLAWHSEADTLALVREPDLIQGAQVMSVTAMRLANLDKLLPRGKK